MTAPVDSRTGLDYVVVPVDGWEEEHPCLDHLLRPMRTSRGRLTYTFEGLGQWVPLFASRDGLRQEGEHALVTVLAVLAGSGELPTSFTAPVARTIQ